MSTVMRLLGARHVAGPLAADDAARRPRHEDSDGALGRAGERGHAAVRLHHADLRVDAVLLQRRRQVVEVVGGARADEGVHRRGGEALVLADHVHHLRRAAHVGAGHLLQHDLLGAALVGVVEEGEEEADDHRVDLARLEEPGGGAHLVLVERGLDAALGGQDALADGHAVAALDQRARLPGHVELDREVVRPLVPRHVQDVAEAPGGEHAHLGAGILDHGVGRDGGAVDDLLDGAGRDAGLGADLEHAPDDPQRLVLRRARHLVHEDPPAAAVRPRHRSPG